MANICDNTLNIYSENPENLKYIESFFKDWGYIEKIDEENLEICFDSKWTFPEEEMDKLYEELPDKSNINMACLSVEWGCLYCQFHTCTEDGWEAVD